jgi:hypothetical protein
LAEIEHALHTFMAQVTTEMASEYDRIFARSEQDPGTAGDEGEENWASLLRDWLPPQYHITTKGRLIGANGEMSPQADVLVLKPFYPQKLREKKIWLADGVAAVFECKTTLKRDHIVDSSKRSAKFKNLFDTKIETPRHNLMSPLIYGVLAHSHSWKSKGSDPVKSISSALDRALELTYSPINSVDLVCVSDVGSWSSFLMPYYLAEWAPDDQDELCKIFGGKWGPVSSMTCSAIGGEQQAAHFRPIGAALTFITERLAWHDAGLRDLAKYYLMADLSGSSAGRMHFWPQSVLSETVRHRISTIGGLANGERWNDWSMAFS